jgi:hypothetical protein
MKQDLWPELPYAAWQDTYATLHLWTQIVGKIRLAQTSWVNHSWHVTLYVSPRGLTTSSITYGQRSFELEFDFLKHVLRASSDAGSFWEIPLRPRAVAEFYTDVMQALSALGIAVRIYEMPNEIPKPIRFTEDYVPHPTTENTPRSSGAFFCKSIGCCMNSGRLSSASAAPSISFRAALI